MSNGKLLIDEPAPAVARLTISNPAKRGALDSALLDALEETIPSLDARCVIITGEGTMFSAGYDIGDLADEILAEHAERLIAHPFTAAIEAIDNYPYPTVAVPPARLGVVYSHTGIRKFIDAVGASRTRELFFVARNIDAPTALEWGLINAVVDPDRLEEQSLKLAVEIAAGAPLANRGNKRVIRAVLQGGTTLQPDIEQEVIELRKACFSSEDFREGVRAFGEKRAPQWRGR